MPRGLSQERFQRQWDAVFGAAYALKRDRQGNFESDVAKAAALKHAAGVASEAVTALRERERRNRSKR